MYQIILYACSLTEIELLNEVHIQHYDIERLHIKR